MMRSTIKTYFVTGGGLLATWLAVTPNPTAPVGSNPADAATVAAIGVR
jgi:hypothetical protein